MQASLPIQCRCGAVRGTLSQPDRALRVVCYCLDCQTYAHALGAAETVLNSHGGTDIVATLQQHVQFTHGREHLACMLLTDQGIYRWYAACCRTPLASTMRQPRMSYVGLVHSCLASNKTEFSDRWPTYVCVNTASASGNVRSDGLRTLKVTLSIAWHVVGAVARGTWRRTPFFVKGTTQPSAIPVVLPPDQRENPRRAIRS